MRKKRLTTIFAFCIFATALLCFTGCGKQQADKNSLVVLNYGKYVEPTLIQKFEKETGIDVKYEEYESVEDMYAKYTAGSINYDVICTSEYMIETLGNENQLIPIDYASMKNYDNVDERIIELSGSFDPTHEFTVPYFYGTLGILYNTKYVTEEEASSWDILFDKKFKNNMIMINSQRDAFAVQLTRMGRSLNETNFDILAKALEGLKKEKKYVYAYLLDETAETMIAEDAALAVCYSGEALEAADYNENLAYKVPNEGSNLWIDSWFVPRTCKHYDAAMKWIDFLNRPDNAIENFYYVWYPSPCKSVADDADEEDREDENLFPTDELLNRCEIYTAYDEDTLNYTTNLWKQLKAY